MPVRTESQALTKVRREAWILLKRFSQVRNPDSRLSHAVVLAASPVQPLLFLEQ